MKGTPAHKLPRWRSTIKRGILLNINNKPVASSADVTAYIQQAKAQKLTHIRCKFATLQYQPLHPHEGSLMLYYDQLNVIAKHLTHSTGPTTNTTCELPPAVLAIHAITDKAVLQEDLGKTFKLKELKARPDWNMWQQARYKMLDDYSSQDMFSDPMMEPKGANVHHMMWRYSVKHCGTRKARMVCDGSVRQGAITLGHTFANSLDAASE